MPGRVQHGIDHPFVFHARLDDFLLHHFLSRLLEGGDVLGKQLERAERAEEQDRKQKLDFHGVGSEDLGLGTWGDLHLRISESISVRRPGILACQTATDRNVCPPKSDSY